MFDELRWYWCIVDIYIISFPSCEWMIVSVFDDDTRLTIHLCELACDEPDDAMFEMEETDESDGHTALNSLDFLGIYKGILPCADCEGIETIIELGTGNSYSKKATYLGKENQNVIESSGTFTWNDAGNTITLTNEESPNQYFVGENVLFHLDLEGNRISGDLADKYQLVKE